MNVFDWLIQTSPTVRSNLHSTICPKPNALFRGGPWGWWARTTFCDSPVAFLHNTYGQSNNNMKKRLRLRLRCAIMAKIT